MFNFELMEQSDKVYFKVQEAYSNLPAATEKKNEQDRRCTYNVTLRCVPDSLLSWKSNEYYIFVCECQGA